MASRLSPTLNLTLVAVVATLLLEFTSLLGIGPWSYALTLPIGERPWTLVTSVFVHGNLGHLVGNMVPFVILGLLLERQTTDFRFYAFFLVMGALTGLSEVLVSVLLFGERAAVLGASGAIFAMIGYLLSGNRLTDRAFAGVTLSGRQQLVLFVLVFGLVTVGVTLTTQSARVAIVAHISGMIFGLLAGRAHVLRTKPSEPTRVDSGPL